MTIAVEGPEQGFEQVVEQGLEQGRVREAGDVVAGGRASDSERVSWRSPAPGLWVAETPTQYLGMVDRNHDGFAATGRVGQDLGVHATREDAQLAVYTAWFLADNGILDDAETGSADAAASDGASAAGALLLGASALAVGVAATRR